MSDRSETLFETLEPPRGGLAGLRARVERDGRRRLRVRRVRVALVAMLVGSPRCVYPSLCFSASVFSTAIRRTLIERYSRGLFVSTRKIPSIVAPWQNVLSLRAASTRMSGKNHESSNMNSNR